MMNYELKIISSSTFGQTLSAMNTVVYLSSGEPEGVLTEEPIGYIQHLKFEADVETGAMIVEITFPKFPWGIAQDTQKIIAAYVEKLSVVPGVKIFMKDIETKYLSEVGTEGFIEKLLPDFESSDEDFEKSLEMIRNQ